MNETLFIAGRLRLRPEENPTGRGGRPRRSPGIVIAVTGIAVSIVVMLLSIAIVTGFKHQVASKVKGFDSQITITPASEGETLDIAEITSLIKPALGDGADMRSTMVRPGLLKTDDDFVGIVLKSLPGRDDEHFISRAIVEGEMPVDFDTDSTRNSILISRTTADRLGLSAGDKVFLHFVGASENIKTRKVSIAAIYDTHLGDYDSRMAFSGLPLLQKVARVAKGNADMIEINGLDDDRVDPLTLDLDMILTANTARGGEPMRVDNVNRSGAMYLNWLSLLDTNVVVILVLMALVAGFTLVASTFIIILERVNTIGILKTLGMTDGALRRVFGLMALRLVAVALAIGNLTGIGLVLIQKRFEVIPLDPEAYFLDKVPVELNLLSIVILNLVVVVLAAAALLIPTRAICRIPPAQIVKYE